MADRLLRQSPLRDVYVPGHYGATGPGTPGIHLRARPGLTILDLQLWPGAASKYQTALNSGAFDAVWFGPDRWLLSGASVDFDFDDGDGLLADISHGMTVIRLSGPKLRDLLSKGTDIDLRPQAFDTGSVAMTKLDHLHVTLHLIAGDCVHVYCRRSYAVSLFEWLLAGAREYGCLVEESEGV